MTLKDFEKQTRKQTRGLFITREKKKLFLELFERRLLKKRSHRKRSLLEAIEWQVGVFKNWAISDTPLEFYRWEDV